jgi:lipid-binding SYLF domain-containing protein
VITFFAVVLPATSVLAQASGYVRVKILKAGVIVGAGGGSGVLTYRGRDYPFRVSGLSMGLTAGASVSRLEGRASGIRQVSDFAGTYSAVGAGGAFVGGLGGVHLGNEKGVTIAL